MHISLVTLCYLYWWHVIISSAFWPFEECKAYKILLLLEERRKAYEIMLSSEG